MGRDPHQKHLLAFCQASKAIGLDGRVMTEDVLFAIVPGDEAVPFFVVEPLDGSGDAHALLLVVDSSGPRAAILQCNHSCFPESKLFPWGRRLP